MQIFPSRPLSGSLVLAAGLITATNSCRLAQRVASLLKFETPGDGRTQTKIVANTPQQLQETALVYETGGRYTSAALQGSLPVDDQSRLPLIANSYSG